MTGSAGSSAGEAAAAVNAAKAKIEASWQGLLEALAGVPAERMAEPGVAGKWSIKDIIGHVAYWDDEAVAAARRQAKGIAQPEIDWQAVNEREASARATRTLTEQRTVFERAHAAVVRELDTLATLDPTAALGVCGCLQGDTYEHYDEHAADIRAWRERVGV